MRLSPLERDIQKAIQDAFWVLYRIRLIHVDAGGKGFRKNQKPGIAGYSGIPTGFPDLVGVIPPEGRAIYVECKRPGGKPTLAQSSTLCRLRKDGAIALLASSVDMALKQYEDATKQQMPLLRSDLTASNDYNL